MSITFLYPNFLWALSFVLLPILIHLFNFRKYKTVYFSDTSLLQEVVQKSKSKKEIKNWLLLLLRSLLIVFLVLLFAQPKLVSEDKSSNAKETIICIDNSPSMNRKKGTSTLLNEAKYLADQLIQTLDNNSKIKLLHVDNLNKAQFDLTKSSALENVAKIKSSNASFDFNNFNDKSEFIVNQWNSEANVYWFSDFNFKYATPDTANSEHFFYEIAADINPDVFVDSVALISKAKPGEPNDHIRVFLGANNIEQSGNVKIDVLQDGVEKAQVSFSLKDSSWVDILYQPEKKKLFKGQIVLSGDGITFNNHHNFSFKRNKVFKTLLVTSSKDLAQAFAKLYQLEEDISIEIVGSNQIPFERLNEYATIILGELNTINPGLTNLVSSKVQRQTLVVIPGKEMNSNQYNDIFGAVGLSWKGKDTSAIEVASINKEHELFKGVFEQNNDDFLKQDIAKMNMQYSLGSTKNWSTVIRFENQTATLVNRKNIFVFSSPLSEGNFLRKPIFVPVILRLSAFMDSYGMVSFPIGENLKWKGNTANNILRVSTPNGAVFDWQRSVGSQFVLNESFSNPGFYYLLESQDTLDVLALNIGSNEFESGFEHYKFKNSKKLNFRSSDEASSEAILIQEKGRLLWPYFMVGVILLLLAEMYVSKWSRI